MATARDYRFVLADWHPPAIEVLNTGERDRINVATWPIIERFAQISSLTSKEPHGQSN